MIAFVLRLDIWRKTRKTALQRSVYWWCIRNLQNNKTLYQSYRPYVRPRSLRSRAMVSIKMKLPMKVPANVSNANKISTDKISIKIGYRMQEKTHYFYDHQLYWGVGWTGCFKSEIGYIYYGLSINSTIYTYQ